MVDHRDIMLASETVSNPEDVRSILLERVNELLDGAARSGDDAGRIHVARLVMPVPALDPFLWLHEQEVYPKIFWRSRREDLQTAAVSAADRCFGKRGMDFNSLRSQLDKILPHSDTQVRYFGGFRFDLDQEPDAGWEPFGTYDFVLPRFEFVRHNGEAILACNIVLPDDLDRRHVIHEEIGRLVFPQGELSTDLPLPASRQDAPDRTGWTWNVNWVLDAFGQGGLEKVVLARRAEFGFADALDPVVVFKQLRSATDNCFHFCFQPEAGTAFLGATPERLFRRRGRSVWSEAVAGTRPRGETAAEDELLLEELLASEKDQREHAYVRESIRTALEPLCEGFSIETEASGMRLSRGWHLVSHGQGILHDGVHGSDVMRALHPTPAVGGNPTGEAMQVIRRLEPFDRGWYTGPIGWIGTRGAEFAVALRCGLVNGDRLALYSGAGIVEGSDPVEEWAEIEQKIGDFFRVFGLDQRRA